MMPATSVQKESGAAPKPSTTAVKGQQESFGDIEEKKASLRRDLLQVVKGAAPTQEQGKQVDAEKFVKELFEDKLETESWVTANQNMHFIKNQVDESKPRQKAIADLVERFCPSWFQMPKHKKD